MEFSLLSVCVLKSINNWHWDGGENVMCMRVLFCWSHKVNTMAIGDKLNKKVLFDPQARNALLIQSTQTALMKFMELFAHSVFFLFVLFFSYIHIHISV